MFKPDLSSSKSQSTKGNADLKPFCLVLCFSARVLYCEAQLAQLIKERILYTVEMTPFILNVTVSTVVAATLSGTVALGALCFAIYFVRKRRISSLVNNETGKGKNSSFLRGAC